MNLDEAIEQIKLLKDYFTPTQEGFADCEAILAAMMQAKARMTGSSSTYGDLPETISRQIVSHEWDNKTPCEQRDWLIARLASAEKVVEAAKALASKAERKKGTTAQWIVWNSELTPLDEALSLYTKGQADAK